MELHLPASEADIKLHDLLHLAYDVIPAYGTLTHLIVDRLFADTDAPLAHMQDLCSVWPCFHRRVCGAGSAGLPRTVQTLRPP